MFLTPAITCTRLGARWRSAPAALCCRCGSHICSALALDRSSGAAHTPPHVVDHPRAGRPNLPRVHCGGRAQQQHRPNAQHRCAAIALAVAVAPALHTRTRATRHPPPAQARARCDATVCVCVCVCACVCVSRMWRRHVASRLVVRVVERRGRGVSYWPQRRGGVRSKRGGGGGGGEGRGIHPHTHTPAAHTLGG